MAINNQSKTPREMALRNEEFALIKYFQDNKSDKVNDVLLSAIQGKSNLNIIEIILDNNPIIDKEVIKKASLKSYKILNKILERMSDEDLVKNYDDKLITSVINRKGYHGSLNPLLRRGYPISQKDFKTAVAAYKAEFENIKRNKGNYGIPRNEMISLEKNFKDAEDMLKNIKNNTVTFTYNPLKYIYYGSDYNILNENAYKMFIDILLDLDYMASHVEK